MFIINIKYILFLLADPRVGTWNGSGQTFDGKCFVFFYGAEVGVFCYLSHFLGIRGVSALESGKTYLAIVFLLNGFLYPICSIA